MKDEKHQLLRRRRKGTGFYGGCWHSLYYSVSGIIISYHDSDKDKVETEDLVSLEEAEKSETSSFQSTFDVTYHQEEPNNKTDMISHISDVAIKKVDEVAEEVIEDANKVASQEIDDALMKRIGGIRSDGNILPLPVMTTENKRKTYRISI